MIFRRMEPRDVEQVAVIESQSFSEPWQKKHFEESFGLDYVYFMVVEDEDGKIAGYCGTIKSGEEADVINVAIRPDLRGRGIGREMLLWLIEQNEADGIRDFTLEVRAGNAPAIALYEHLGFESAGIRPGFYTKPKEDALIMWRRREC